MAPDRFPAEAIDADERRLLNAWVALVAVSSAVVAVFNFFRGAILAGLPVLLIAVVVTVLLFLRSRISRRMLVDISVVALSLAVFAMTLYTGTIGSLGGVATISLALTPPLFLLLVAITGQRLYQLLTVLISGGIVMILWLEVFHFPAIVAERDLLRVITYPSFIVTSGISFSVFRTARRSSMLTERLAKSEQRYRGVFDGAVDAIIIHTLEGEIVDVNSAAAQTYGCSRDDLIGRSLSVISSDSPTERDKRLESMGRGETDSFVVRPVHRRADGSHFPAEVRVTVIRGAAIPYCVAAVRDMSRVRAQERRIEFQARILDSIAQSILVVDRDGIIVYANEYTARFSGVPPEDLTGAPIIEKMIAKEDREIGYRILEATRAGETWTGEVAGQTAGSFRVPALIVATPIADANNQTEHIIVLVVDIRDRKQMEQQLRDAKKEAEDAAQSKSVFLASMSHEIRNPLNGIIGFADLLMEQNPRDDQREALTNLIASGRSLLSILGDVLSISKFDSGRYTLQSVSFDLDELLARVEALYGRSASEKGLELRFEHNPQMPVRLVGDPDRIQQLLGNLVSNAIKYTDIGSVTVRVDADAGSLNGELQLVLQVTDTGIGIEESEISRLFGLFERADNSNRSQGTGLGLAISERLARSMDGSIEVGTKPGHGSTFTATVRVAVDESDQAEVVKTATPGTRGRSLRVLVVDDDPINRLVAQRLLEARGHSVTSANDGAAGAAQAISAATMPGSTAFDLILMDYVMPELDGLDATRRIRDALGKDPLIVGLTARVYKDDQTAMLEAGMSDFAEKPITSETLNTLIDRYFSGER